MSADKFTLSPTVKAQMTMMSEDEKALLNAAFASEAGLTGPSMKTLPTGDFGSRVGRKLVLWRMNADRKREIVTIADESYLERQQVPAHAVG